MIGVCIQKAKGGSAKHLEMLMRHPFGVWTYAGADERREAENKRGRFERALAVIQLGRFAQQLQASVEAAKKRDLRRIPADANRVDDNGQPE